MIVPQVKSFHCCLNQAVFLQCRVTDAVLNSTDVVKGLDLLSHHLVGLELTPVHLEILLM